MDSMMKLPDDMFRQELLRYLTVYDIVKLDNACINHEYRPQLLETINGVILLGDKDESMKASLFKWLAMRRIYLINMYFNFKDGSSFSSSIENDYEDQFKYTRHVVMRGAIRDDMAMFIISHCNPYGNQVIDHTLQSIAVHYIGVQSLSMIECKEITDAGLVSISEHCPNLKVLKFCYCNQITYDSIISISTNCTGLHILELNGCSNITDTCIISISTHCIGLQLLNLECCNQITDASIISISTHCTGLQSLNLYGCDEMTDASIMLISTHCTGLQSLDLVCCHQITDVSIISISENCTGLKRLDVFRTAITDASLIAIAKNCTGLQLLDTYDCNGLSSKKLRRSFKSVSELRATLLSIYPSFPI